MKRRLFSRWIVLGCLNSVLLAAAPTPAGFWQTRVPLIEAKMQEVVDHFAKDDIKAAKRACDDAYFGIFEDISANMEVAVRGESAARAAELESQFGDVRKLIVKKSSQVAIQSNIKTLINDLKLAAADLDRNKVKPQ